MLSSLSSSRNRYQLKLLGRTLQQTKEQLEAWSANIVPDIDEDIDLDDVDDNLDDKNNDLDALQP